MKGVKRASLAVGLALLMVLPAVISGGPVYGERSARLESAARQAPIPDCISVTNNSVTDGDPAVAYNTVRDEFLVVWTQEIDEDNWGIYGQRISSAASLIGSAITIDTYGLNAHPDVAYDPSNDQYLVVYYYDVASDDTDIWGRIVQGNGTLPGSVLPIDQSSGVQSGPRVAYNSQDHEYLVVYHNYTGIPGPRVAGRLVDSNGNTLGTGPTTIGGAYSDWPDVAYNAARNEYLVVYVRPDSGGAFGTDVYAHLVSHELAMIQTEFGVGVRTDYQSDPAVAAGTDEYLVVWDDARSGATLDDIYARRVPGNGVVTDPDGDFLIGAASEDVGVPTVAYGPNYAYLVAWTYLEESGGPAIISDLHGAYVIPGTDQVAGSAFGIDTTARWQDLAAAACAPTGDCLVAENDTYIGEDIEIKACFVRLRRSFLPLALPGAP